MGLRMSSSRFESSDLSSERLGPQSHHHQQHRRSLSPGAVPPRTRSLSHNQAATGSSEEPGTSFSRRPGRPRLSGHSHSSHQAGSGHNVPSVVMLDRLISEIEANGGVIPPDDPQFMRLLRAYRHAPAMSSEGGETGGRARPASIMDVESLLAAAGPEGSSSGRAHRSRRAGGGRQRASAFTSAEDDAMEERLAAVRRQVLLSLAAASSSSPSRRRQWPESLLLLSGHDRPCPFCRRVIPADDYDLHYVMCLTLPRVTYNEDTLQCDKGECSICLEDMKAGDKIARLPCLCIYHKHCIDDWFQRKQTCPEHPGD
ncbi:hypothetical protein Aperf_G00000055824 [Anoplocephala perfoliata]